MKSDGSSASYYDFPANVTTLGELMDSQDMNAERRELFISMLRYSFDLPNVKWEEVGLIQSTKLQHLISQANMNFQIGECFKAIYRFGEADHSDTIRDLNKIDFYLNAEIERIEKWTNEDERDKLVDVVQIEHMLQLTKKLVTQHSEKPDSTNAKS